MESTITKVTQEIDFSKPQLVELSDKENVILTNGFHTINTFEGTFVYCKGKTGKIGFFCKDFEKLNCSLFNSIVNLKN